MIDRELLVANIKARCEANGVKPTNACRDSGVGASFISDIIRGQTPSVAKVQQLAQYLGCTVSDLLGEVVPAPEPGATSPADRRLLDAYRTAPPDLQAAVRRVLGME